MGDSKDPRFQEVAFERCLDYLDAAVVLLSQPRLARCASRAGLKKSSENSGRWWKPGGRILRRTA